MTKKLFGTCFTILLVIGSWATAGNDRVIHMNDGDILWAHQLEKAPNTALLAWYDRDGMPYDSLVVSSSGELSVTFLVNGGSRTCVMAGSFSGRLYLGDYVTREQGRSFLIAVDQEVHEPIILPGQIVDVAVNSHGEIEVLCREDGLVKYIFDPGSVLPLEKTYLDTFVPFVPRENVKNHGEDVYAEIDPAGVAFVIQPETNPEPPGNGGQGGS